jgi:arylsulfatase
MKDPATGFKWELYNISKDWTENNDVAASNPQKLEELRICSGWKPANIRYSR